jgi:hypothetical protein
MQEFGVTVFKRGPKGPITETDFLNRTEMVFNPLNGGGF